jgi:hypothetical protein
MSSCPRFGGSSFGTKTKSRPKQLTDLDPVPEFRADLAESPLTIANRSSLTASAGMTLQSPFRSSLAKHVPSPTKQVPRATNHGHSQKFHVPPDLNRRSVAHETRSIAHDIESACHESEIFAHDRHSAGPEFTFRRSRNTFRRGRISAIRARPSHSRRSSTAIRIRTTPFPSMSVLLCQD